MQKTRQIQTFGSSYQFQSLLVLIKYKLSYWWKTLTRPRLCPPRTHSAYIVKNTCCWGSRKVLLDQCHSGLFGRGGGRGGDTIKWAMIITAMRYIICMLKTQLLPPLSCLKNLNKKANVYNVLHTVYRRTVANLQCTGTVHRSGIALIHRMSRKSSDIWYTKLGRNVVINWR